MFLFQKNRGAISVFLIIILVPCMLVSSIFVDISRVWLAKSVAESSAELALNTLMANYDYDLSESYGLVGSCQDIDKYYDLAKEYYDVALHSQDVEDDDVKLLYQRVTRDIGGRFKDETISDMIQVQNKETKVGAVEGATMQNPTVMEKQVVEFMKYRGPILIVQQLIDLLTTEEGKGGVQGSEEATVNKPMEDAQKTYYESESELLKAANRSYWAMRDYTKATAEDGHNFTRETFRDYSNKITSYRSIYEQINQLLIKNLYNTSGLAAKTYTRPNVKLDYVTYEKDDENISYKAEPSPAPSDSPESEPVASEPEYCVTKNTVNDLTDKLQEAINTFDAKKEAVETAGKELLESKMYGSGDDKSYEIQWWVQMDAKINSGTTNLSNEVTKAGKAMIDAYAKVKAMRECTPDDDVDQEKWEKSEKLVEQVEERQKDYLGTTSTKNDLYVRIVKELETVSQKTSNKNAVDYNSTMVSINGSTKSIPAALSEISGELKRIKNEMDKYAQLLDDVIDGNSEKGIPSLAEIRVLIDTYNTNLDKWETTAKATKTADGKNTELSKEHQDTIDNIRDGRENSGDLHSDMIVKLIKKEDLDVLETRFDHARSQFRAMSKAIDEMQYGNRKVMDIADFDTLKSAASSQVQADAIPLSNKALSDYATGRYNALFKPVTGNVVTLHDLEDKDYSPEIHYLDERENVPPLYYQYYKLFKDKGTDAVEEGEEEKNQGEQAGKDQEKAIKEANGKRYPGTGKELFSDDEIDKNGRFDLGASLLGSMTTLIKRLVKLDIASIRDDIYTTEYIMNMFSYATFETENCYDLVEKAGNLKDLSLNGYADEYKKDAYRGAADKDGTWLSVNPEDSYNKTLTNEMINVANNHAYQAEIEYILAGKSNADSVKDIYDAIYGIRLLLNGASGLLNFWGTSTNTGRAINVLANALSGLTAFIIPAPLFKIVMIGTLTIFETGKDLDRLQAGFPVELYKGKDDWWISLPEFNENSKMSDFVEALKNGDVTGESQKIQNAHGLRYSDYLTIFVYLGLSGKNETAEGMYRRMSKVIEANMRLRLGGEDKDYSLEKTKVYFEIDSKLRVDPLMMTIPYYSDYVTDPTMKDDWCTFDVEKIRGY